MANTKDGSVGQAHKKYHQFRNRTFEDADIIEYVIDATGYIGKNARKLTADAPVRSLKASKNQ